MVSNLHRVYTVFLPNYYCRSRETSEVSHDSFYCLLLKCTSQLTSACSIYWIYTQSEQRATIWKFHILPSECRDQMLHRCCSVNGEWMALLTIESALLIQCDASFLPTDSQRLLLMLLPLFLFLFLSVLWLSKTDLPLYINCPCPVFIY